jgi:hypothetical protein
MKSIRAKIMWLLFYSVLISSLIIGAMGIFLTANVINQSSTENMRLLCKNNADNIDAILDAAYTSPALADVALLGLLLEE